MRFSLKSKFYLLALPALLIVLAMLVLLALPQRSVVEDTWRIREGLEQVLQAESFARHFEHQVRQCAAFIATGSAEHERMFEDARKEVNAALAGWMSAKTANPGAESAGRAQEIKSLEAMKDAYEEVNADCDRAIAVAKSGSSAQAVALLEDTLDAPPGSTVLQLVDELLPDEETRLVTYLDNLDGAVRSLVLERMLGLAKRVAEMRSHALQSELAVRFARDSNRWIRGLYLYVLTGRTAYEGELARDRRMAAEALGEWAAQARLTSPVESTVTLFEDIDDRFLGAGAAARSAIDLAKAGDTAGALAALQSGIDPVTQSQVTEAIDAEVERQGEALEADAGYISSTVVRSVWGVGFIGFLALIVVLAGGFMMSRTMVDPVVKLRDAAREFGETGGETRVEVKRNDEMGDLTAAFNEMAAARVAAEGELREAHDHLEVRVRERTRELADANEELRAQMEERERAEHALQDSEERYRFLADNVNDYAFIMDLSFSTTYSSPSVVRLLGFTPEEQLGRGASSLMTPESLMNVSGVLADELERDTDRDPDRMRTVEVDAYRKDGTTVVLEVVVSFVRDDAGSPVGLYGLARDITERKEAERRLEELNEELLSINRELDEFAYVVSHDLKAPLRGIGSLATWLHTDYSEVLDQEGGRQLELLLDRAKRMESLIESVLEYSRVGRIRESREPVDLNDVVRAAVEMIGPPPGVKVTMAGSLPSVVCERMRMSQVFQNLIGNAVKFMDRPDGEVTVSYTDEGTAWRLAVADNGPGIDPKYQETIFGIFQTISPRDEVEGTGLGLTLVKKIVEMHGGRVWVESEVGEGATFYFTIPKRMGIEGGTDEE
ncbi:MAG: PAS domain S-box protein [Actinobacteria bacterium]|nr:PAS domain S-box protein [Actinomycetota bacterium]MBU1943776.1 PAS domain S-box protein [Actinomycetota bacterium]MBU2688241.1 PAS domain S-box protein [Actinomycetota bacterium]